MGRSIGLFDAASERSDGNLRRLEGPTGSLVVQLYEKDTSASVTSVLYARQYVPASR